LATALFCCWVRTEPDDAGAGVGGGGGGTVVVGAVVAGAAVVVGVAAVVVVTGAELDGAALTSVVDVVALVFFFGPDPAPMIPSKTTATMAHAHHFL